MAAAARLRPCATARGLLHGSTPPGFPRELGFIRRKQLQQVGAGGGEGGGRDVLLEVIIPRVFDDGCAAQFRVNAVPGQSMLSM